MEEGHKKSNTLSYMAKLKCEVICAEEKGNSKVNAVFVVSENNV
jgi:hypothetical protein